MLTAERRWWRRRPAAATAPVGDTPTVRQVLAELDRMKGVGTDHPGIEHSYCRLIGRQSVAFTRCCKARVEFSPPQWNCEIGANPAFGVGTTCCERPYYQYGESE